MPRVPLFLAVTAALAPQFAAPCLAARSEIACVGPELHPPETQRFVRAAISVLRQAGHDPSSYRVELRVDDPLQPYLSPLGGETLTSVVFVPREGETLYPLRVSAQTPCAVSWLPDPERLTPWQQRVVARARELFHQRRPTWSGPSMVQIHESRDAVAVELWVGDESGGWSSDPGWLLRLRKRDLSVVENRSGDGD